MSCIGVSTNDIAKFYKMPKSTVSTIVRRLSIPSRERNVAKPGRRGKLTERGTRLLKKYVLQNCFEPLYVITRQFNETHKLHLSVSTIRRYM